MKRWIFRSLFILAGLVAIGVTSVALACFHYGVWSWHDWEIYKAMRRECHPVWRDLHTGRIKAGDDIEGVIWRTYPPHVEKFENVTMLSYPPAGFTVVSITAKDGRIVSACAASCTWSKVFFDTWDADDCNAFWTRYSAHLEAKRRAREIEDVIAELRLPLIFGLP